MSRKLVCGVLAPLMLLHISAPVLAGEAGNQVFITAARPLSQGEMDQYSQQQSDADQSKLLCQGADVPKAVVIVVEVIAVACFVSVVLLAISNAAAH